MTIVYFYAGNMNYLTGHDRLGEQSFIVGQGIENDLSRELFKLDFHTPGEVLEEWPDGVHRVSNLGPPPCQGSANEMRKKAEKRD